MDGHVENKLNLFKLKGLIDSGISSIPVDKKHSSAVLVIGDTGVGKTTILSFLAKRKLFIKIHGLNTILDSDEQDGLKIGHDRFSETRVPSKIIIDKLVFFDCSGFKDNRGEEYEISNSFFVQRLFDIYSNIKILLIVDESSVSQTRADKLPKLIRNLLKSFDKLSDIQDGVILLINRAKPEFSDKTYSEELIKMAKLKNQEGYLFNQEERNFIEFLVKNKRVCLFKQAEKKDEGKALDIKEENLMNLIRDTNFVKSKKIKNIISESAKLSIREFIDHLADKADAKLNKLCQEIMKEFTYKSHNSCGDAIVAAKDVKNRVVELSRNVESVADSHLVETLEQFISADLSSLDQDVTAVLFFKEIYNKSDYYFKLIRSSLASTLSKMVLDLDDKITALQAQQKHLEQLKAKISEATKKQEDLANELETLKSREEGYKIKIAEDSQKHEQKVNELSAACEKKNKEVEDLKATVDKIHQEKEALKGQVEYNSRKSQELSLRSNSQDTEIQKLTQLLSDLHIQIENQAEEIELLNEENNGLKAIIESKPDSLNTSQISKSSKYPDVVCPHFKNGGKCVHCIKAWKAKQKEMKEQL